MTPRDFALLAVACLLWGVNLPLSRWIMVEIPPLTAVAIRFAGTAIVLAPGIRRLPPQPLRTAAVGFCVGGLQFALQYAGVARATASSAAIVAQLSLPFAMLLSALALGERLTPSRVVGSIVAFLGVALVAYDPRNFGISPGLVLVACSALSLAVGAALMKRLEIAPFELQAWTALVSILPTGLAAAWLESDRWSALAAVSEWRWAGLAYSIAGASIAGQAIYYGVVRRNELSVVTPLTLMAPVWAVVVSATLLGEHIEGRSLAGAGLTLTGILIILSPRGARTAHRPLVS